MSETQDNILWSLVLQPLVTNVGRYCWVILLAIPFGHLSDNTSAVFPPSFSFFLFISLSLSLSHSPPSLSLSFLSLQTLDAMRKMFEVNTLGYAGHAPAPADAQCTVQIVCVPRPSHSAAHPSHACVLMRMIAIAE